jgi:multidrug transporter EmrE-like cation transporter
MMNTFAIAVISIGLSVAAQFLLKVGMSADGAKALVGHPFSLRGVVVALTNGFVLGGLLLYALSAISWLSVLSKWDVSKAYPLVGLGFVLTVPIGMLAGEDVTAVRSIGVALICAGVWIVAKT